MEHYFFTFQSGTIQAKGYIHTIRNNLSLHSNLVQFKLLFNQPICHDIQSLYIPIWYNSSPVSSAPRCNNHPFTFQSGTIQANKSWNRRMELRSLHSNLVQFKRKKSFRTWQRRSSFTFQSGTIQALLAHRSNISRSVSLHSNLVQFKHSSRAGAYSLEPPLHSNLVQFKRNCGTSTNRHRRSLHSNLVQFKRNIQSIWPRRISLYIPIWYNSSPLTASTLRLALRSLHSNLVQFKHGAISITSFSSFALHSNLVQFKPDNLPLRTAYLVALHSNLVQFKPPGW